MPSRRIVITGAGGQLGRFLAAEATRQGRLVLALTSSEWDVTDPDAAARFVHSTDIVVNCAAYTAVDAAETNAQRAHAVNADGACNVARACATASAQMIHISTDYVFSGKFDGPPRPYEIDDPTCPLSVYGRTKLAGERAVHAELPAAQVVRTSWLYSGSGNDFVAAIRKRSHTGGPLDVVADQVGSPTYVGDLVAALLQIIDDGLTAPLLHAANAGAVSRFEQARAVFDDIGADPARVCPVGTDKHPRPAKRPPYSALSQRLSARAGLTPLRPWRDALAAALATPVP